MQLQQREIEVVIEDRLAEAVADVLVEVGAVGAQIEDDETRTVPGAAVQTTGQARVCAVFAAGEGLEARVAGHLSTLLSQLHPPPEASVVWRDVLQQDWSQEWKKRWTAQRLGQHVVIVPTWEPFEPAPDDVVITLDPGMAFGTGTHETTQLCVQALEQRCRPGTSLLDVGCGTGILALIGARLGAQPVLAIDNDADAIRIAGDNARQNGLDRALRFALTHDVGVAGQYDVVVANILLDPLLALCERIVARVAPTGELLLSGLLETQLDKVARAYRARGLIERERRTQGEWGLLRLTRGR